VIVMPILWSCSLFLSILFQTGTVPSFPDGIFTAKEKEKIVKNADDIGERIEAYRDASIRIHKTLLKTISDKEYSSVSEQLKTWMSLLSESIKDIESSINPKKKKSKALIKYEIQVRKAVNDLRDYKIRAPYEQQDILEQCIDLADAVRGKMVDLLFQPEKTSGGEADK